MNNSLIVAGIIVGTELLSIALFVAISRISKSAKKVNVRSVIMGLFERVFIVFSLLSGYPQALTFFAALKIGTRIKDEQRISNDYYLIGNLISVGLAILYTLLFIHLLNINIT